VKCAIAYYTDFHYLENEIQATNNGQLVFLMPCSYCHAQLGPSPTYSSQVFFFFFAVPKEV
jgi:hypothetical protein